jgi:hypothetical protein
MEWITTALGGLRDNWAETLLGIAIVLILTGRIVPKFRLDEARVDRDNWRLAHQAEHEARVEGDKNNTELIRSLELVKRALDSMTPPPPQKGGGQHETT